MWEMRLLSSTTTMTKLKTNEGLSDLSTSFFPQKIQVIPSFPQSSIMAESDYYLGSTNAHSGYSSATK